MSLLGLFKLRLFTSLSAASAAPAACRRLQLQFIEESLENTGSQFAKLSRLQELYIQGDVSTLFCSDSPFSLPAEIGQLRTLQRLVLLNLPIDFPQWIINLTNLRSLTVRGIDLLNIPLWIHELKSLRVLEVANCGLATLPVSLRQMSNLQELWLTDTPLLQLTPDQLPPGLKHLNLTGSACCTRLKLAEIQAALSNTVVSPDPNHPGFRTKADLEQLLKRGE
jgi:hypothetical protein